MTSEQKPKQGRGRPKGTGLQIPPTKFLALQQQGMNYQQIADTLGVGKNHVSRLLTIARNEIVTATSDRLQRFNQAVNAADQRSLALLNQWEPENSSEIILDRLGSTPLRFPGVLIREGSTKLIDAHHEKPNSDWWDVRVYRTELKSTPFAIAIDYSTTIRKVASLRPHAWFATDPVDFLQKYEPLEYLRGFPDLPQYQTQQDALKKACTIQWQKLLTQLLREPF